MNVKKLIMSFIVPVISLALLSENIVADNYYYKGPLPSPSVDSNFHDNGSPAEAKVALGKVLFFD